MKPDQMKAWRWHHGTNSRKQFIRIEPHETSTISPSLRHSYFSRPPHRIPTCNNEHSTNPIHALLAIDNSAAIPGQTYPAPSPTILDRNQLEHATPAMYTPIAEFAPSVSRVQSTKPPCRICAPSRLDPPIPRIAFATALERIAVQLRPSARPRQFG